MKLIDFQGNPGIDVTIGCTSCQITQAELNEKLQTCFGQTTENLLNETIIAETKNQSEEFQNFIASLWDTKMAVEGVKQELSDLKNATENMKKVIEEAMENNNKLIQNLQKSMESQLKNLEEKFDALQSRLTNSN